MIDPNEYQVGGSHYQRAGEIQHWDIVAMLQANYFIGCATKYLTRFHHKNGAEDLEKAAHFIIKAKAVKAPSVSWWRMRRHSDTIDKWLSCAILDLGDEYRPRVEAMVMDAFNGEYQAVINQLRYMIPQYRHATEPTSEYNNQ